MSGWDKDGFYSEKFTRRDKRELRKAGLVDPVQAAYDEGCALAYYGPSALPPRLRSNPYPPGRRRDEWNRGAEASCDPMGDWHGRNV